jgi:1-aminocyclopropane-1-carboxylate deaminase/D-cysteine desulfhydrase-like pyridoxal-dependent ACC family enzyme
MTGTDFPAIGPTPIESAPRLAERIGLGDIRIKRDDLIGFAGGGTKCRKLAGIAAKIRAAGADTLLLSGGATSNQARLVAALAARLGCACEVFLDAGELAPASCFARLLGASVHAMPDATPWTLNAALRARLRALGAEGRRAFVVPAASADDLACYAAAVGEIASVPPRAVSRAVIVIAAGSGATTAGLLLGIDRALPDARVVAVSVDRAAAELATTVARLIATATGADPDGADIARMTARLAIDERFRGNAYESPPAAAGEAVELAARAEGLLLEPVYTGRALAALCALAGDGGIASSERVVFWHTGGVPYLAAALDAKRP